MKRYENNVNDVHFHVEFEQVNDNWTRSSDKYLTELFFYGYLSII